MMNRPAALALMILLTTVCSCNFAPKATGTIILQFKGSSNTFVCEKGMSLDSDNGLYIYGEQSSTGQYLELNMPDIKKEGTYSLEQLSDKNPDNKITFASSFRQSDIVPFSSAYHNQGTVKIELDGSNATVTIDCMLNNKINDSLQISNGQYIGTFVK